VLIFFKKLFLKKKNSLALEIKRLWSLKKLIENADEVRDSPRWSKARKKENY